MSHHVRVRPIGDLDLLHPLIFQLDQLGVTTSQLAPTTLALVGATTVADANRLLTNLSPRLRPRTVIVGLDDHLDLAAIPGSLTELLERMQVLGCLPRECAATSKIQSFVGACGYHRELAQLVGAEFFKFGPSGHKVWTNLPDISAGAFLVRLVEAIEEAGTWFDMPPAVRYAY